ncbi:anthranilate synthase component I family protein [Acidomonas methanolica]|uniref:anthranilate synthase component I family protein n=1 Tax=Acidomonas methanolica TaxID=437 RepID=UPI00211A65C4|nr:anthranilate synthase component I family protein [Acidomonas methanolica]MCQ9154202.1 anthranilate synthase component I family protein [Acidomonas methanolica]
MNHISHFNRNPTPLTVPPHPVALPWRTPDSFLAASRDEAWLALLDSNGPVNAQSRWTILCRSPSATLVTSEPDGWDRLRALLPPRASPALSHLPYLGPCAGGVIGMASYGAGLALEAIPSRHRDATPHLIAARFDDALVFDRQDKRLWWTSLTGAPPPDLPACTRAIPQPPILRFTPDRTPDAWRADVRAVIEAIAAGEIFQANLTQRWRAPTPAAFPILETYRALRRHTPAPFGGVLRMPGFALLSASVERFLHMDATGRIETRPIKGTAPLGATPEESRAFAEALGRDGKEYAENLMITDLMRNDIGRVCAIGSVEVAELCAVERFAHWHHLVSSIRGRLAPGLDAVDLLRATLPPGSVTGAPKHRAMDIIDRLEHSARGPYCGTLFRIGADGTLDSNVIIRSIAVTREDITIGAGGGITYPSDPAREYDEMILKAAPLLAVFGHEALT